MRVSSPYERWDMHRNYLTYHPVATAVATLFAIFYACMGLLLNYLTGYRCSQLLTQRRFAAIAYGNHYNWENECSGSDIISRCDSMGNPVSCAPICIYAPFVPAPSDEIPKAITTHELALLGACENGNVQTIYSLLKSNVSPNFRCNQNSPLREALFRQNTKVISLLLNYGAWVYYPSSDDFSTGFMFLCENCSELPNSLSPSITKKLLYSTDATGRSALHYACAAGNEKITSSKSKSLY